MKLKRFLDIILSLSVLLLFLPLLLIIGFMVRVKLGSPILFIQERPGFLAKPFLLMKFRSMKNALDSNGELLPDNKRLTRFGRFIRASSLDELPELINVLKGDMSLVGPRPLLMEYLDLYTPNQARRHESRPGITGWAQVNGRNSLSWEEKFNLDVWYVDNQSFLLDMKILLLTVTTMFKREGITQEGHVTAEKFKGTVTDDGQ